MTTEIRHEAAEHRYALYLDGELSGVADYMAAGGKVYMTHTEVFPAKRQNGLGAMLVQAALDDIRFTGAGAVVPQCSFVGHYIRTHPDYEELLAS